MTKAIVVFFLLALLDRPQPTDFPEPDVVHLAWRLSEAGVEALARGAAARNLHYPEIETLSFEHSDGAFIVLWRRAQGRPLPYPVDPVLGTKEP